MKLTFDAIAKNALQLMESTSKNIFLTGKAGTGKSTLLLHFLKTTKKNIAVLAPTGVAALNIGGSTIHSFFGFPPTITLKKAKDEAKKRLGDKKFTKLDSIVIDEISMVRADIFDCMNIFLQTVRNSIEPFGGVQLIMIGDLYQLPPVVTSNEKEFFKKEYSSPYFFDANIVKKQKGFELEIVELEKIYRQSDPAFIDILNAIRTKTIEEKHLSLLNRCVTKNVSLSEGMIYLAGLNAKVDTINEYYLEQIDKLESTFSAKIKGNINPKQFPADEILSLKEGAQVMFVANDPDGRWVNGTLGKIQKIQKDFLLVQIYDGELVEVKPYMRNVCEYSYNSRKGRLDAQILGSFQQIPLTLAWAVTIHKSQGKTFDNVIIDLSTGIFAHGQTYVALSRCRSLQGIRLTNKVAMGHIRLDYHIVKFLTEFQYKRADALLSVDDKVALLQDVIKKKGRLKMTYLKAKDIKSRRVFEPYEVGDMVYNGVGFLGVRGYCHTRGEERVFRIDRILEIEKDSL